MNQFHLNIPLVIEELGVEPESMMSEPEYILGVQSQPKNLVSVFSELRGQDWVLLGRGLGPRFGLDNNTFILKGTCPLE